MQLAKIKISLHNAPPDEKCVYFKLNNYFSELKTEVDKARARYNLGIADAYSLTWEAISGKPDIQSLLDTLKQQIIASYALNNLSSSLESIRSRLLLLESKTEGIDQDTITDVNKLWSDVARNSRDILALQSGGDTSVISRITKLENDIANISVNVDLTPLNNSIADLTNRIITLENNQEGSTPGSNVELRLTSIENLISLLSSIISSNQLLNLSINPLTLNNIELTDGDNSQTVVVTASYSKIEDLDVTSECLVNTSNSSVATWDNINKKILIHSAGNAILTFSFRSKSVTCNVVVTEAGGNTPPVNEKYYIGWATNYEQIVKNSNFETSVLAKTWNDTNLSRYGNQYPTYLWACTPVGTVITKINWNGIEETPLVAEQYDNYNIYYLGYAANDISGVTLTITTSNG